MSVSRVNISRDQRGLDDVRYLEVATAWKPFDSNKAKPWDSISSSATEANPYNDSIFIVTEFAIVSFYLLSTQKTSNGNAMTSK